MLTETIHRKPATRKENALTYTRTLDQQLQRCLTLNHRHPAYQASVDFAKDYATLASGKDFVYLLKRLNKREDAAALEQRALLTHQPLTDISTSLRKKQEQLRRVQGIRRDVQYENVSDTDQKDLASVLEGQQPGTVHLDEWFDSVYDTLSRNDPNAVAVLEFAEFDNLKGERASPYPVIYHAPSIWWREFAPRSEILSRLVVALTVVYLDPDGVEKVTTDLIGYEPGSSVRYFDMMDGRQDIPDAVEADYKADTTDKLYRVIRYTGAPDVLPAVVVGAEFDPAGSGAYVSPLFAPAWTGIVELLNTKSTSDLIEALHGYPRRFEYTADCEGETDMLTGYKVGCTIDGKNPQTGNTCQMCGGTHLAGHKSEQDVVKFPMPLHQDDIMKLSDLVFSEKPDLETLKYYREQVEVRRNNVYRTIFSGNQQTRPTGPSIDGGNVTATEAIYNRDGENNTLLSIADARSLKYRQLAGYIARLMFIQGTVKFIYEYPRDLKLASLAELYADLMAARAANVPDFELEQICDDMARKRYEADPDSLRKYFVKKQHVPYIALSIGAFQYYDSVGLIPKRMAVLIANQDIVFGELEEEDDGFYKLPFVERDKRVTAKVATIESQLPVAPPEIGG